VAVVSKLANKIVKRQLCTKGEAINKTIQKHKIENENRKQGKKHKKNIKKHKSSN